MAIQSEDFEARSSAAADEVRRLTEQSDRLMAEVKRLEQALALQLARLHRSMHPEDEGKKP